jgi:hypothetical protein
MYAVEGIYAAAVKRFRQTNKETVLGEFRGECIAYRIDGCLAEAGCMEEIYDVVRTLAKCYQCEWRKILEGTKTYNILVNACFLTNSAAFTAFQKDFKF